ncbi:tetratricopeptide repeat-containing diguanylate cyclase [Photobacterium nomapromontoriensis]|uniref:tetratricopeptide repeat-containing diguanylate cyclase n=1 Tax=Photobacterium nomapromontoriensis TaxID=2910237 RepID=UPI003D128B3A
MRTKITLFINILTVFFCLVSNDVWASDSDNAWQERYYINRYKNPVRAIEILQAQYQKTTDISEKLYLKELIYNLYVNSHQPYNNNSTLEIEKKYISALNASTNANQRKSIIILSDLLNDAISHNDIKQQELFNYQLCKTANKFGQYTAGEHYCNNLLSFINQKNYKSTVPRHDSYIIIANNKMHQGLYTEALDIYTKIINLLPIYVPAANAYNNIALILIDLKKYDDAEVFLNKALQIVMNDPSKNTMAQVYHSMAKLYDLQGKNNKAIDMYKNAITLISNSKNYYGMSSIYLGLGDLYLDKNDFVNAEKYLNIAKSVAQNGFDENMLANSMLSLGIMFSKKNEVIQALYHLKKALQLSTDFDIFEVKQKSLKAISDIYFKANDSLNAYLYYKQYANNLNNKNASQLPRAYKILDDTQRERELYRENHELKNQIELMKNTSDNESVDYKNISISLLFICATLSLVIVFSRKKADMLRYDPLTGVLRRESIIKIIQETNECKTQDNYNALILFDIDHFKLVNDTYGHPAGDAVLVEIAMRLQQHLGDHGLVGRLGGEEFIILLRNTENCSCVDIQNIHDCICDQPIQVYGKHNVTITVSSAYLTTEKNLSAFIDLYTILDQALYFVKNNGRNSTIDALNTPITFPNNGFTCC